jgi:CubicO group peptidase (beta-lactamase class C family)
MKRIFKASAVIAATLVLMLSACTPSGSVTKNEGGASKLERVKPSEVGMDETRLAKVDDIINASIEKKEIPGAVLAVVRDGKMAYIKAYGNKSVYPEVVPMIEDVVFDLASCSKVVGTAMSMAHLLENGGYRLTDRVDMYIPGFQPYEDPKTGEKVNIRMIDVLTHSSGLPSYVSPEVVIKAKGKDDPDSLMSYIAAMKRIYKPTTQFEYSCLNFITLQNVLQNITGMTLADYAQKNIFDVLGMTNTTYMPKNKPEILAKVAPTEKQPNGECFLGEVHDPLARVMNHGNSGNAGVFSNADDLAILAAALMNGGNYNGKQVLGKLTVETMTTVPEEFEHLGRSLGWDNYSPYASNNGNLFHPKKTFGHTGYTGTSFIVDPVSKTAVILLAHRVHPADKGSVVRLRALVANVVAGSIVE